MEQQQSCVKNGGSTQTEQCPSAVAADTYVAVAYRWGWTNAHWYLVAAGGCRAAVTAAAQREADDRGGKYGVAVYRMTGDAPQAARLEAYFPSLYEEAKPHSNPRLAVFQSLGQRVCEAVETGSVGLPGKDGSALVQTPANVPQWLHAEKKRLEELEGALAAVCGGTEEP